MNPPDNGGNSGGMDHRITRLEAATDTMQRDISDIRTTLARIEAKLESKVDYKWMTLYVLGIVAAIMKDEIIALFR